MSTCEMVHGQLALLLYGELSFDEEEQVETHLEGCADCRAALERQAELHAAFDQAAVEPSAAMLRESREELRAKILMEPEPPRAAKPGWWDRIVETLTFAPGAGWLKPAGAFALVAMGFLGARLVPSLGVGLGEMSLADPGASRVRSVEPGADGRIQIVLDETRQRVVSGSMDDRNIQDLLRAAAKDPSEGLRAETVELLTSHAQTADVRDLLVYSLGNDENAGVRLRAMEGLKPFAREPEVRKALAGVLLGDANPGMRKQAIDLLTQGVDEPAGRALDQDIVGTLQELMNRESNAYVRERGQRVLELVNASAETY